MDNYAERVRDAVLAGDWPSVFREATAWVEDISRGPEGGSLRDPRAHFALNVVHLIKGEFGKAWKLSATSLQEASDIEQVRDWTEAILAQHSENANVQLVMGLFLRSPGSLSSRWIATRTRSGWIPTRPILTIFWRKSTSVRTGWRWRSRSIERRSS